MRSNPFVISGYAGSETFCDRVEETKRLISLIDNGNNVVLTAPRRVGKTDLIRHVFAQPDIKDNYITMNVDIYATQNFRDFVLFLGKAISDALKPLGKKIVDRFVSFLQSLRAELTFDINGMPVWTLGITKNFEPDLTLDEIFRFLNESHHRCVIAIDEFQQIGKYPDASRVEALLRTYIQRASNANFIFSGSQQHLMTEMFVSPSRPFYMSSTLMSLPLLDKDVYADFCQEMFVRGDRQITREAVYRTYDMFNGVTAYMQRVMNEMYATTDKGDTCDGSRLDVAVDVILRQANDAYQALFYQLTERQRATIAAIAMKGEVRDAGSSDFVRGHNLVSSSSVRSSINTLIEKDLLTRHNGAVSVYDHFFRIWLLRLITE